MESALVPRARARGYQQPPLTGLVFAARRRRHEAGTTDRTSAGSSFGNRYTYTGRYWDADAGLYYYRNRWYSCDLARFTTRDPAGYVDGASLYAYARCRPSRFLDSLGFQSVFPDENSPAGILDRIIRTVREKGEEVVDEALPESDTLERSPEETIGREAVKETVRQVTEEVVAPLEKAAQILREAESGDRDAMEKRAVQALGALIIYELLDFFSDDESGEAPPIPEEVNKASESDEGVPPEVENGDTSPPEPENTGDGPCPENDNRDSPPSAEDLKRSRENPAESGYTTDSAHAEPQTNRANLGEGASVKTTHTNPKTGETVQRHETTSPVKEHPHNEDVGTGYNEGYHGDPNDPSQRKGRK